MSLPADIGNGIVVASFGADGSWLSIGTTDEDLGFVELNGLPRFDEAKRSHLAAVRRYRQLMADPDLAVLTVAGASVVDRTAPVGRRVVEQRYVAEAGRVVVLFAGRLDRPAYAEVTDISPLPPLGLVPSLDARGPQLSSAPASRRHRHDRRSLPPGIDASWTTTTATTASLQFVARPPRRVRRGLHARSSRGRATRRRSDDYRMVAPSMALRPPQRVRAVPRLRRRRALHPPSHYPRRRRHEGGILTDHRILPLSWNRDAYYQALSALLPVPHTIAAHLRWLWQRCDRPGTLFQCSHQANGLSRTGHPRPINSSIPCSSCSIIGRYCLVAMRPPPHQSGHRFRRPFSAFPQIPTASFSSATRTPPTISTTTTSPLHADPLLAHNTTTRRLCRRARSRRSDSPARQAAIRQSRLDSFRFDGPLGAAVGLYHRCPRYHPALSRRQ